VPCMPLLLPHLAAPTHSSPSLSRHSPAQRAPRHCCEPQPPTAPWLCHSSATANWWQPHSTPAGVTEGAPPCCLYYCPRLQLLLQTHCCWAAASRLPLGLQTGRWPVDGRPRYLLLLQLAHVQQQVCRWLLCLLLLLLLLLLSHLSGTPTASSPGRLHHDRIDNNNGVSSLFKQAPGNRLVGSIKQGALPISPAPCTTGTRAQHSLLALQSDNPCPACTTLLPRPTQEGWPPGKTTRVTSRACVDVLGADSEPPVDRRGEAATWSC
jgi:hypothetical protein